MSEIMVFRPLIKMGQYYNHVRREMRVTFGIIASCPSGGDFQVREAGVGGWKNNLIKVCMGGKYDSRFPGFRGIRKGDNI